MSTTTTTVQTTLGPQAQQLLDAIIARGREILNREYVPYTEPRLAPFTEFQQLGFDRAGQISDLGASMLGTTVANALATNAPGVSAAFQPIDYILGRGFQASDLVSGVGTAAAPVIFSGLGPLYNALGLGGDIENVSRQLAQRAPDLDISAYQNPYIENVVQRGIQDLERRGAIERQRLNDRAVSTGSFGGSRNAIAQAEMERNLLEEIGRFGENARANAFENAYKRLREDQSLIPGLLNNALQAYSTNLGQVTQQALNFGGLANLYSSMLTPFNVAADATRNFAQGQGTRFATEQNVLNSILGRNVAGISGITNAITPTVSLPVMVGGMQQALQQANLDQLYQDFLTQRDWPVTNAQIAGSLMGIVSPAMNRQQVTQVDTRQPSSTFSNIVGGLGAGIGLLGAANRFFPETMGSIGSSIGSFFRGLF